MIAKNDRSAESGEDRYEFGMIEAVGAVAGFGGREELASQKCKLVKDRERHASITNATQDERWQQRH